MKRILVVGPSLSAIGGISTYLNGFMSCGLSSTYELDYFDTFSRKGRISPKKSIFEFKELCLSIRVIIDFFVTCFSGKYDAIYLNSSSYWGFWEKSILILVSRVLGVDVYLTIHGAKFFDFYNKSKFKKVILFLMGLCKKISFVSKEMEVEFRFLISKETLYLPNPVVKPYYEEVLVNKDLKRLINRIKLNYDHIGLSLSLLEDRKRVIEIIDTYGKNNDVALIVAGDGPDLDLIRSTSEIYENVFFVGSVIGHDKSFLLKNCDVFIQNSLEESFGITIIEALLCRKILLSSNVGVLKDNHLKYENLIIMDNGITPIELRSAVNLLNKGNFETKDSYLFALKYSWERQLSKFVSFFSE